MFSGDSSDVGWNDLHYLRHTRTSTLESLNNDDSWKSSSYALAGDMKRFYYPRLLLSLRTPPMMPILTHYTYDQQTHN